MPAGQLFIISSPSGGGKSTILEQVMADLPGLSFSVSHTTRQPRANETEGREYHFVDREHFIRMRDQGKFLEWAEVHGNLYGTSIEAVQDMLDSGLDVILDIDIQGARQIKNNKDLRPISIFIIPPSLAELERRLTERATDNPEAIDLRLKNAVGEMVDTSSYDHVIVNDDLDEAVSLVKAVILSERSRNRRGFSGLALPEILPAD